MRRLIICEKQLAARRIAGILSGWKYKSQYMHRTRVYTFEDEKGENIVIGLSGHITALDYPPAYNDWANVNPADLVWIKPIKVTTAKNIGSALHEVVKDIDEVVIATDFDREGELIGAEALELIKDRNLSMAVRRAKFSALTNADIETAFGELSDLDRALVKAAECRQNIDLVWGAVLTRILSLSSNQVGRSFLSVGRVQTPTLAAVVDREREIVNFVPKNFWNLNAVLHKEFDFESVHTGSPFWNKDEAGSIFEKTKDAKVALVKKVEKNVARDRGPVPFNTTMFLADASRIDISAPNAMRIAEDLYTEGYISYPRTDNCAFPPTLNLRSILQALTKSDLGAMAQEVLDSKYRPRNGKATKDHPPIHPVEAATRKKLKGDHWRVYELVVRRFLATLSPDGEVEETRVELDINGQPFVSNGSKTLFEGWRKYYPYYERRDVLVPELAGGEEVGVLRVQMPEGKTRPPARFSHGSLIQQMENLGLGTKSTRHEIIKKLLDRKYVQGRYLKPTYIGMAVTEALEQHAKAITEPEMTATLEHDMNDIAEGKKEMDDVVEESRLMLQSVVKVLQEKEKTIGEAINEALKKHNFVAKCDECGGDLLMRRSNRGKRFVSCSEHPNCNSSYPLPQTGILIPVEDPCQCGAPQMKRITGRWAETLCIDPECSVTSKGKIVGACRTCGGNLVVRFSRHGKRFIGCSKFPRCRSTFSLPQKGQLKSTDQVCKVCSHPLLEVSDESGTKTVCINEKEHKKKDGKGKKGKKASEKKTRKSAVAEQAASVAIAS